MRSDTDIKRDVEDELRWDPDIDSTDIAVTVKSGVVTLAGFTRSYSDKLEAEAAAKRWLGSWEWQTTLRCACRTLTSGRIPKSPATRDRGDQEPTTARLRAAQGAGSQRMGHSRRRDRVDFQRMSAERAVRRVKGVKGVTNSIQLKPRVQPTEIKRKIEEAFRRSARSTRTGSPSRHLTAR